MSDWKNTYEELTTFIAQNHGLELTPRIISIPPDVREEFYRRFDRVRISAIKENFPGMLEKGQTMGRIWHEISLSAIDLYKLQKIDIDTETKWFLENPVDGLIRLLFDPLFDVLRGKTDLTSFEKNIPEIIKAGYYRYMRDGYHAWTSLSLLQLMRAEKLLTVKPSELDEDPSLHVEMAVPGLTEDLPEAKEATAISFKRTLKFSFLVPNVIGRSQQLNSFVSFVPDFEYSEAKWIARSLDQNREWYKLSGIQNKFGQANLWPDIAIYTGEQWKDVVIAADTESVGRPDIILELRTEKDWYEREGLESIRRHYDVLNPKSGCFVVCLDEVPQAALEELAPKIEQDEMAGETAGRAIIQLPPPNEGIETASPEVVPPVPKIILLSVGFDASRLSPIIEALSVPQAVEE